MTSPLADINAAFLFGLACGSFFTIVVTFVCWVLLKEAKRG